MTWPVSLAEGRINLFVEDRISKRDALRQEATSHALLSRLARQPGVILADEVGMGKTFVALAVALAAAWADKNQGPVVIMMPSALKEKWQSDFQVFLQRCVASDRDRRVRSAEATNGLDFFRFLAQPPGKRPRIVFLTHGALSRTPEDPWVKFAIMKRAMHGKRLGRRRDALPGLAAEIIRGVKSQYNEPDRAELFRGLMRTSPEKWNRVINSFGQPLPHRAVPLPIADVLRRADLDLSKLGDQLYDLPKIKTSDPDRLQHIRQSLNTAFRSIWKEALKLAKFRLPLVVLDEAHHLKNPKTELHSLFVSEEADADAKELSATGALAGGFERMLFLTATPFQLGHAELINVIDSFRGVNWATLEPSALERFTTQRNALRKALDRAQRSAVDFDNSWKHLRAGDLLNSEGGAIVTRDLDSWWTSARTTPELKSERIQENLRAYARAQEAINGRGKSQVAGEGVERTALASAEVLLRPWVIRHLRDRTLPDSTVPRRVRTVGNGLTSQEPTDTTGLPMSDGALLPFLLAARAQSIVAHVARTSHDRSAYRATFAEGLASSYEAFLETSKGNEDNLDDVADAAASGSDPRIRTYIKRLRDELPTEEEFAQHPKIAPVVKRVAALWERGEKVVVFCHYRITGRVLVRHVSTAIRRRLDAMLREKLQCSAREASRVVRSWNSAFDKDTGLSLALAAEVERRMATTTLDERERESMIRVVRRFMRTELFLVRYVDLAAKDRIAALTEAMDHPDSSGTSLGEKLQHFVDFMSGRCTASERDEYLQALGTIHPGGPEFRAHHAGEQYKGHAGMPNVRLASGAVDGKVRRRLLLGFNTPFLPDVLIASSVMAEGVDLHLNCRHMIHHDLAWNPSTIEQRTGRIDRIGAKAEQVGKSIEVALPYVAGTQDEKMFRVVMDRERWFHVVMGEKFATDEFSTERNAERVPLPEAVTHELTMRLEVWPPANADGRRSEPSPRMRKP